MVRTYAPFNIFEDKEYLTVMPTRQINRKPNRVSFRMQSVYRYKDSLKSSRFDVQN